MEILQEYGNCHECSMKLNPEILYFVKLAYFDERKETVRKWSWLWEGRVNAKTSIDEHVSDACVSFCSREMLIYTFVFLSPFAIFESSCKETFIGELYECANESLSTRESFERELRWFCLALTRFYTKIKQIRTLDFVEVVYY